MLLPILSDCTAAQQPYNSAIAPHMITVHHSTITDDRACTADVTGSSHFSPPTQRAFDMNCCIITIETHSHVCTATRSCRNPDEQTQLAHAYTRVVGTTRDQLPSLTERGHMMRTARAHEYSAHEYTRE